jgi:gluconate 2-dehydrogenase gamma chain
MDVTRRNLFQILGAAPAVAAAQSQGEHVHPTPPAPAKPAAYQRKVFDDRQWQTVHVLCDLIIPADEHSGSATAAGVPEFIDDWLDFRKREDGDDNFAAGILGGLAWLDQESIRSFQKNFAQAAVAQQTQILDRIAWPARAAAADRRWAGFFTRFRDLTVSGFFSSKMGVADLPYLGNKAVAEWKGCDPKVWATIEDRMKNGYKALGEEVKPWTF